jgi:hypothetical protein
VLVCAARISTASKGSAATGFRSHSLIHSWARERRFRRRGWSRGATLPPWQPSHHLSTDHRWHLLSLLAWPRHARRGRRRSGSYAGRGIGRISCDEGAELRVETTRAATAFRVASCRCRADWLPCGQAGTLLVRSGRHRRAHRLRWARAERVSDRARAGPEHRGRSIGADTRSCPGTRARWTERADRELVENVRQTTGGQGTAVILDCVGEGSTPQRGPMMTRGGGVFCIGGSGGRIDTRSRELVDQEKTIAGNLVGTDSELGEHRERVVGESHCQYPTIRSPRSPRHRGTCGMVASRDARYSYPEDCEQQKGGGGCRSSW